MSSIGQKAGLSGNSVIDGLMLGGAWSGPTVTYGFKAGDMNGNGVNDFDEGDWKEFHRELIKNVESFTKLNFTETSGPSNITFRLDEGSGGQSGVPVDGTRNVETAVGINSDVAGAAAAVRLGTYSWTWFHELGHALGLKHTHDGEDHAHEGENHASHGDGGFPKLPGVDNPGDLGTTYLNSSITTVMGYTFPFLPEDNPFTVAVDFGTAVNAQSGSYGAIDIAALQFLYGAREANTGDTVYRFSDDVDFNHGYTTIWDTGGADTIEYTGASRAKIDLRAATLKNEIGGGGWFSTSEPLTGGFSIANGVTIENATGGAKNDILIGNDVANTLTGRAGNDVLRGGGGGDRLDGGAGNDSLDGGTGIDSAVYARAFASYTVRMDGAVTVITGEGSDRLENVEKAIFADGVYDLEQRVFQPNLTPPPVNVMTGTAGADLLVAPSAAGWTLRGLDGGDTLIGDAGDDRLEGGSGHDWLDGGAGADIMIGGGGDDVYFVDDIGDVVVEAENGGHNTVESSISYTLGAFVQDLFLTGSTATTGTGNDLDNFIVGNDAANTLNGGGGDDWLVGGRGRDRMNGGTGDDYYVVDNGRDVVTERAGEGTDHVESTVSYRLSANVENLYLVGDQAIQGTGNDQSNIIVGNGAANVLQGLGGDDILIGAGGVDRLIGGAGNDIFQFGDRDTGATKDTADTIVDFRSGDRIDLSELDAGSGGGFRFVGQAAFSGALDEVRFTPSGGSTLIEGDVDGDRIADFAINLNGAPILVVGDFIL